MRGVAVGEVVLWAFGVEAVESIEAVFGGFVVTGALVRGELDRDEFAGFDLHEEVVF